MRRMSFNLTQQQILDQSKTVTRRVGWWNVKVGERLRAVDRLRSKDAKTLGIIEVVSARCEALHKITDEDVAREGFPGKDRFWFESMFCEAMKLNRMHQNAVNRIEFRYVDEEQGDV